jgi:hypothetical protein
VAAAIETDEFVVFGQLKEFGIAVSYAQVESA